MEAKVIVTAYIIMHLTVTDFVVGFIGAAIRVLANYSKAKHKITGCGECFDNARYFSDNWDKIVYGMAAGLGLLFFLPETIIHASDLLFGKEVTWNSGFSGIIGLAGVEVVDGIIRRTKSKINPKADEVVEPIA